MGYSLPHIFSIQSSSDRCSDAPNFMPSSQIMWHGHADSWPLINLYEDFFGVYAYPELELIMRKLHIYLLWLGSAKLLTVRLHSLHSHQPYIKESVSHILATTQCVIIQLKMFFSQFSKKFYLINIWFAFFHDNWWVWTSQHSLLTSLFHKIFCSYLCLFIS